MPEIQNARHEVVNNDSGSYAVFTDQGSSHEVSKPYVDHHPFKKEEFEEFEAVGEWSNILL